ncbi:MAG: hypothetical protein ACE5IR_08160 [bacterium]
MNVVLSVLKDLGIDEKDATREYALLNASQKAGELAHECDAFKQKYRMSFEDFEKRLRNRNQENFDEEDDYLAWKCAVEGLAFWRKKVKLLKSIS